MKPIPHELFHVHTHRCKHAGSAEDYEYVEKAIELGAPRIVFTDHAPFPGNPFGNRMDIEELPEYVSSINALKDKYANQIEVVCGLEIEYLPGFHNYYEELRKMPGIDILIIGQHFYEHEPGKYSFLDEDKSEEYIGLCNAIIQGIETGLFDVAAHPDRAFRRRKEFGESEKEISLKLIEAAKNNGVFLEKNYSSTKRKNQYKKEFWELVPGDVLTLHGVDAHSVRELEEYWEDSGYLD